MATHSSILAWRIPWAEEPGRLEVRGVAESDTTERLHFHFSLSYSGSQIRSKFFLESLKRNACHLL